MFFLACIFYQISAFGVNRSDILRQGLEYGLKERFFIRLNSGVVRESSLLSKWIVIRFYESRN
jgi:hypothetical protein